MKCALPGSGVGTDVDLEAERRELRRQQPAATSPSRPGGLLVSMPNHLAKQLGRGIDRRLRGGTAGERSGHQEPHGGGSHGGDPAMES